MIEFQTGLCRFYHQNFSKVSLYPWTETEGITVHVSDLYIEQAFHIAKQEAEDMLEFFDWRNNPYDWRTGMLTRSLLLEAEQGMIQGLLYCPN